MLHSKVANLVKVGTVLVTLLASQTLGTGVSMALAAPGDQGSAKIVSASTLPVFVDRQDASSHFRTVVTPNDVVPASLHNVLSL